jgi:hypothetical protein
MKCNMAQRNLLISVLPSHPGVADQALRLAQHDYYSACRYLKRTIGIDIIDKAIALRTRKNVTMPDEPS